MTMPPTDREYTNPNNGNSLGGVVAIGAERGRQITKGYTVEHDTVHGALQLMDAALAYITQARVSVVEHNSVGADPADVDPLYHWPWAASEFSFDADVAQSLAKAGALIAAAWDVHHVTETRAAPTVFRGL